MLDGNIWIEMDAHPTEIGGECALTKRSSCQYRKLRDRESIPAAMDHIHASKLLEIPVRKGIEALSAEIAGARVDLYPQGPIVCRFSPRPEAHQCAWDFTRHR